MAEGPVGRIIRFGAFALAVYSSISSAAASDFRILYAERIAVHATELGDQTSAESPARISFQAYGRQFDLVLEPNDRLLANLLGAGSPSSRNYAVYRGRVEGHSGSWVRLTRIQDELHGAFWDGKELFSVTSARLAAPYVVQSLGVEDSATVVYRLSDTRSALDTNFCGVGSEQALGTAPDYDALIEELREKAATANMQGGQIEIAFIADFLFNVQFPVDTEAAMLARINVVDGIFSAQVGVLILPQLRVFTTPSEPFTSNDPEILLNELGDYREATPDIRARGLAHLLTGRNLQDNVAGVAFINSLCDPFAGVGLSEATGDVLIAALIVTHEIGHNFGAPHDAESGSPCQNVPPTFIMAPTINSSTSFSQCSIDQMRPSVLAAACITPAQAPDADVFLSSPNIQGHTTVPFDVPIDIRSMGATSVNDVVVTIALPASLALESVSAQNGTCTSGAGAVVCDMGSIDGAVTRRIDLRLRGSQAGTFSVAASLASSNDRFASNNSAAAQITLAIGRDARMSVTPATATGLTRTPLTLTATVASVAVQAVDNVIADITVGSLDLASITSDVGTCTVLDSNEATCNIGTVAAGASVRIDVQVSANRAGTFFVQARTSASNDGDPQNNFALGTVILNALSDAAPTLDPFAIAVPVNQPFQYSAIVRSLGPEAVSDVRVSLSAQPEIALQSVAAQGGTCTSAPPLVCSLGTIEPGGSRRIDLEARADQVGSFNISFSTTAANDDNRSNDSITATVTVRHTGDVALSPLSGISFHEGRLVPLAAQIASTGLTPASNVTVVLTLPTAISVGSATITNGTCSTAANAATCTLATLAPGSVAFASFEVTGEQIGDFTGTVTANASNDAEPANNSRTFALHVLPFFDAGVELPAGPLTVGLGQTFDLPITITTDRQPVNGISLDISSPYEFDSASGGIVCTTRPGTITCPIGTLPARSSLRFDLRLRAAIQIGSSVSVRLSANPESDPTNNFRSIEVRVVQRGDAAIEVSSTSASGTLNVLFPYPQIVVTANQTLDDVGVDVTFPNSFAYANLLLDGSACAFSQSGRFCHIGTMAAGSSRRITFMIQGFSAGTFSSTVQLVSPNDTNPQNDSRGVSLTVTSPPPPPSSGGGGGGGGGSLGVLSVLWLFAARAGRGRARPLPQRPSK